MGLGKINPGILGGQKFFGARFCLLSPFDIDVRSQFSRLGEEHDAVREHFHKSPRTKEIVHPITNLIADLADTKFGQKRSVAREDTQISRSGGNGYAIHLAAEQLLFGSNDLKMYFFR